MEFNPFELYNDHNILCDEKLDDCENELVNKLRYLWRSKNTRDLPIVDPIEQKEKEKKEKQYRSELRYVTQMYTSFKECPIHFRIQNDGEEEEYFEYAEPNWNILKEYSQSKNTGRKRGRPKKEVYIVEPIEQECKSNKSTKSNWIVKLLKWHVKGEKIKTTRQYQKFLHKDFPLKTFKNKEYKIPKKQWKLRKQILHEHFQRKNKLRK